MQRATQQENPRLRQQMRWYRPNDPVSLSDIRQAGCSGVVTALHQVPVGEVWDMQDILERRALIEAAGMEWTVVESLPVPESVRRGDPGRDGDIQNYIRSMRHLAACGLQVITYNFMPVLDWLRTDVAWEMPDGSRALYFNRADFEAFDLFMLQRPGAAVQYGPEATEAARRHYDAMPPGKREQVYRSLLMGLPGSDESFTPQQVLDLLAAYRDTGPDALRANLVYFLERVAPVAQELGLRLAIHPDDPPYPVLGLPRVVSTEADLAYLLDAVPLEANGLCFCTGSLGARPDNDLPAMIRRFAGRIHFLHLRNTRRDEAGNFYEADHLDGDTDMYAVMCEVVRLMRQRGVSLPMRPDHGHQMLDDLRKTTVPGYSAIGRLRGLAELRGLELGVQRSFDESAG